MKYDPLKSTKPWISGLCCYTPGKTIKGYVKLASNENNYGPSPKVFEAIKEALTEIQTYPHRDAELREKIASYCGTEKDNLIVGNGSDELLDLIFKTFRGPVHATNPTYSEYRIFSEALGEKYAETDLKSDFSFDVKRFLSSAKNARILVLCSPNNPTGTVISEKDFIDVLNTGKLTVIDEAYAEFCGRSFIGLVRDYKNLIVMRTFSKAFALAGLRIGYLIADEKIIEALSKVKPPFSVNSLAQAAAIAALDDAAYMKNTVERIKADRGVLYNELCRKYRTIKSESNFILFDVEPAKSKDVYDQFMERKIILRDFGEFRGFKGQYLRVSVGTTRENEKFVEVLREI